MSAVVARAIMIQTAPRKATAARSKAASSRVPPPIVPGISYYARMDSLHPEFGAGMEPHQDRTGCSASSWR
jgi:hypothetical protein